MASFERFDEAGANFRWTTIQLGDAMQRISPSTPADTPDLPTRGAVRRPKTIAILDDEIAMLELLGNSIAGEGFEVLVCTDKRIFLEELPGLTVDLVITDLNSPGMNGMQFLAEMCRNEKWRNIPVIIASGMGGAEGAHAKSRGAYEAFAKPFRIEDLLAVVKRALAERQVK